MKNISYFNVREARSASQKHQNSSCFSSSSVSLEYEFQSLYLQICIINQINLIIFHPTPSVILIKWNISFVTDVF